METTSNYVGIYHNLVKSGLLNNVNSKTSLELTHQNIIPLSRVNQFFFGTNLFANKLNYLVLHRESMVKKYMGIYWLYISKIEKYLTEVCNVLNLEDQVNCCPFNYLKIFGQTHCVINNRYYLMINALDSFLNFLKLKNTTEANTIVNIMAPNSKNNNYKLEVEVVDILELDEYLNDMVLKFDKKGKPLFITLSWSVNKNLDYSNMLRISNNVELDEYETLFNYICEQLKMDTPEEYLINNLDRVCGSREFSEIMVK